MPGALKRARSQVSNLHSMLRMLKYNQAILVEKAGQAEYEQIHHTLSNVVTELEKEVKELPVGHRYTGTFYLRNTYTIPHTIKEITGSAFMREDLVSWILKSEDKSVNCSSYVRELFKDKELKHVLKREDGEPLFSWEAVRGEV